MFGFQLIVVGNMPNTDVSRVIDKAKALGEGDKIERSTVVRVYKWAWLGDWIETVLAADEAEGHYDQQKYPQGIIPGAPNPDDFHLLLSELLENGGIDGVIDRLACAWWAAASLVDDGLDTFKAVYGVVLSRSTWVQANSRLMLKSLWEYQSDDSLVALPFQIRVFVVDRDNVEMHKLGTAGEIVIG